MFKERCVVEENKKVAPGHYVIRMRSKKIAPKSKPGQFVQVLCSDLYEPFLPRPFSFLEADKHSFSFLYQVVGKGTKILSSVKKGDELSILGPLGQGFTLSNRNHKLVLVGGGVGIPPLYHWAKECVQKLKVSAKNIHVFLGARDQSLLLCEKEFKKLGVYFQTATDNGSKGHKGFVTDLVENFLRHSEPRTPNSELIYTCGPTPMLKAVSVLAQKYAVSCEVSVEVPMACGFGACLGCAIKVRSSESGVRNEELSTAKHRFAIACCEGPVFQAQDILWE